MVILLKIITETQEKIKKIMIKSNKEDGKKLTSFPSRIVFSRIILKNLVGFLLTVKISSWDLPASEVIVEQSNLEILCLCSRASLKSS